MRATNRLSRRPAGQAALFLAPALLLFALSAPARGGTGLAADQPEIPAEEDDTPASLAAEKIAGSPPGIIDHILQKPSEGEEAGDVRINFRYPSLGRKDIDADIRSWVAGLADAFERHFDNAILTRPEGEDGAARPLAELQAEYSISWASPKAVSIIFEIWNYAGGPYGNMDVLTLNYSLITGQRLGLVDIFEQPGLAIELMSQWSRAELTQRLGNRQNSRILQDGTAPLAENFSSLALIPSGVRVHFQPYQVAGGEWGAQKVDVPLEALTPAGPLLALWNRQPPP